MAFEHDEHEIRPVPTALKTYDPMRDRKTALEYVAAHHEGFTNEEFWSLLGWVWLVCAKHSPAGIAQCIHFLASGRPQRDCLMTEAERQELLSLNVFEVCKGAWA